MESEYVGVDLHRRRSVIVRKNSAGKVLSTLRIDNSPLALAEAVAAAGESPEVVLEATYGWYWAADVLDELGARVHLAHPLGNAWGNRRVKNDERDAEDLVDLLRIGRLAGAWVAPPGLRELRELVRHRAKLVALRSGLKAQVHAVLAKEGVSLPAPRGLFSAGGRAMLAEVALGDAYRLRVDSLVGLIGSSTPRWPASRRWWPTCWPATAATPRCRRSPGWARCWRRCSWPRSAMSVASPPPPDCARGRG